MFSFLLSIMLTLAPMTQGGNGHHWGWRNQVSSDPPPPPVTLVTPRPGNSSPGPSNGAPSGNPNPGPFTFGNE
jgi:hypothetical protein